MPHCRSSILKRFGFEIIRDSGIAVAEKGICPQFRSDEIVATVSACKIIVVEFNSSHESQMVLEQLDVQIIFEVYASIVGCV